MLETIILLTGQIEQPALTAALTAFNPLLYIWPVSSLGDLLGIDTDILAQARLIAFSTNVIVPAQILDQLGYGAYNFHPASPEFPGWAPAYFALHRGAKEFGATAHVMRERVDSGPIVGVERFRIPKDASPAALEGLSYGHLARLFWQLAAPLATKDAPLPSLPVSWSGQKCSRRLFKRTFAVPDTISDEELFEFARGKMLSELAFR